MNYLIKQYNKNKEDGYGNIRVVIDEQGYMLQVYVPTLGEWFDDMRFKTQMELKVWLVKGIKENNQ